MIRNEARVGDRRRRVSEMEVARRQVGRTMKGDRQRLGRGQLDHTSARLKPSADLRVSPGGGPGREDRSRAVLGPSSDSEAVTEGF